jgi:hypothetical protein
MPILAGVVSSNVLRSVSSEASESESDSFALEMWPVGIEHLVFDDISLVNLLPARIGEARVLHDDDIGCL